MIYVRHGKNMIQKVHNPKFIQKFNEALEELRNDPLALSTLTLAMNETLKDFAKQNQITLSELLGKLAEIEKLKEKK